MKENLNFTLLDNLIDNIYVFLPKLIFGILFIIVCWIVLKLILFIVKKTLKFSKIDALAQKLNEVPFMDSGIKIKPDKIILIFLKWFLILIFIIIGSELLNLSLLSNEIGKLINYLPKFFSALVILIVGLYGAGYVKKTIRSLLKAIDVSGGKAISNIVFIVLFIMVSIMALDQAGVNTQIITNNLILILGAAMASVAISFGLGSRDVVFRLLLGFYSKRNFSIGQRIIIDEKEGVILAMDNISLLVKFENSKVVYPIKYIANNRIEIVD